MSRGQSYFISLFRNRTRQNPNAQIRSLNVESRDSESRIQEQKSVGIGGGTESAEIADVSYTEMAKIVSRIMRERHRWQKTLVSDYPSFNFADPLFFREFLKSQNNVLFSLWFFRWLCSNYDYTPDPVSLNLLFGALLDAKAVKAAKSVLDSTDFNPEPTFLEHYVKCLSEEGLLEEAIEVYTVLKNMGIVPSIATSNSVLLGCLKVKKLDRLWELDQEMIESGLDLERIQCLIQALCDGGQVAEGYELLKQALKQGLNPGHLVYNKVISGFCKMGSYAHMSEVLHTMIKWNHLPNIYTYQEILNRLCKEKKAEAYWLFNDLKDKGYAPDRVMYTTMIHGLNEMGWFGSARKLWFEMINKGILPNEFTYNVMLHGHLKRGKFRLAHELYSEMLKNGYGETTVSLNTLLSGFCSHGKSDEALEMFKKMSKKGITPDSITYNTLIHGFCKEKKIEKSIKLFNELVALHLQPSALSYAAIIKILCENKDFDAAKGLWDDMLEKGVEPLACTHDHLMTGLCKQDRTAEGMNLLIQMLENKTKLKEKTFEILIKCLIQKQQFTDCLSACSYMLKMGYVTKKGICYSILLKLSMNKSDSVATL